MSECGVYKLSDSATIPFKTTEMSACYDLCACFHEPEVKFHRCREPISVNDFGTRNAHILLYPGDLALIPTGLIFALPNNYHMKVYSRSGNVWKRKLIVANQPAVIDSDYTHETFVLLTNQSVDVQKIVTGDRIAQCELCINQDVMFYEINDTTFDNHKKIINKLSVRDGGLGSTGK